ncbi:MAG TPA: hypothetical protein VMN35_06440 [Gaiellaceae bacterium]|nr:hypothetical protein [Gaiellaceae bacterium]
MLSEDAFAAMLARAGELRAQVNALPDRDEIDSTVRARVRFIADPPEPPPRHSALIAEILGLLEDSRLTPRQAIELERAYLG